MVFFFSSRRRHTRCSRDWSSDVCSSDLDSLVEFERAPFDAAARSAEAALASAERAHARAVRLAQAGILPQKDSAQAAADPAPAQGAATTAPRPPQPAPPRGPPARRGPTRA